MSRNQRMFAVLAGIGESRHLPPLPGAPNDVQHMWDLCVHHFEVPPENICVVVSGGDAPAGVPHASLHAPDGSKASFETALDWLADKLEDPRAVGLFHFSGHGMRLDMADVDESVGLCTQDSPARPASDPATLVTFEDFAKRFAATHERPPPAGPGALSELDVELLEGKLARLTMTLDCCWNDGGIPGRPIARTNYRIFVGASPGQLSHEILVRGEPVGAFTSAFVTAAARWRLVPQGESFRLTVSHTQLLHTIRSLMDDLGMGATPAPGARGGQTPELLGPRVLDHIPVFHPSMVWEGTTVSTVPDVQDRGRQVWVGDTVGEIGYKLVNDWGDGVLATITFSGAGESRLEQWRISPYCLANLGNVLRGVSPDDVRIQAMLAADDLPEGSEEWSLTNIEEVTQARLIAPDDWPQWSVGESAGVMVFQAPAEPAPGAPTVILCFDVVVEGTDVIGINGVRWYASEAALRTDNAGHRLIDISLAQSEGAVYSPMRETVSGSPRLWGYPWSGALNLQPQG